MASNLSGRKSFVPDDSESDTRAVEVEDYETKASVLVVVSRSDNNNKDSGALKSIRSTLQRSKGKYLPWKSDESESDRATDQYDSSTNDIESGGPNSVKFAEVENPLRPRFQSADSHFVPTPIKPTPRPAFLEHKLSRQFSFKQDPEMSHEAKVHGVIKTSRERKRRAARGKGGEFQMNNTKKKITSICLSTDINIRGLFEHFVNAGILMVGWEFELYADVLHLYRINHNAYHSAIRTFSPQSITSHDHAHQQDPSLINMIEKEMFVFDFGAAVFWGFHRAEVASLLKTIELYVVVVKDAPEFKSSTDDMAFTTSPDCEEISIANDVIVLPDHAVAKQRLSISFAIAQSAVLSVFEARIETKVEEYKFIPGALAVTETGNDVHLEEAQLGRLIGEVFVIRHEVNLHTEILDVPEFFWKEERYYPDYKMVMRYLEMSTRTDTLNLRLDMLQDLFKMMKERVENKHGLRMEIFVIVLILVQVILQCVSLIRGG